MKVNGYKHTVVPKRNTSAKTVVNNRTASSATVRNSCPDMKTIKSFETCMSTVGKCFMGLKDESNFCAYLMKVRGLKNRTENTLKGFSQKFNVPLEICRQLVEVER